MAKKEIPVKKKNKPNILQILIIVLLTLMFVAIVYRDRILYTECNPSVQNYVVIDWTMVLSAFILVCSVTAVSLRPSSTTARVLIILNIILFIFFILFYYGTLC